MPVNNTSEIVEVYPSLTILTRAAGLSNLKKESIQDTFLRNRDEFDRYRSSMIGDIAKLCAKQWLENNGFTVTDWDDVRSSWKSQKKDFDLRVGDCHIEIASSLEQWDEKEKNDALQDVLSTRHIIQPIRKTEKDLILQLYYISDKKPSCFIVGWCLWEDLQEYETFRYAGGFPRDFWMVPFYSEEAKTPVELIEYLQAL